jgi:Holliday junction resolvase RusA-like endonuclease
MTNEFTIKHKLPSLNEVIEANRTNRFQGAKFKKEIEELIGWSIRSALTKKTLYKPKKAVIVRFTWTEPNMRRDCDNIASAKKFILDALVKMRVLENDNQKHVVGFYDTFEIGKEHSVRVELIEKET